MIAQQRTSALLIAGIFVIISACILTGLTLVTSYYQLLSLPGGRAYYFYFLTLNLSYIAADLLVATVALIGGIMSMLRRNFALAVVGAAFVLADSILRVPGYTAQLFFFTTGEIIGLLYMALFALGAAIALILSLLGVLLIAKSRAEFSY